MSRTNARSRRLRRRPSRTVPATIVALVLLALGILVAIAASTRLVNGTWAGPVTGPAQTLSTLGWGSTAVLTTAVVTAVVGLVLLVAGVKPGAYRSAQLQSPDASQPNDPEQTDFVITNRAVARLAAGRADLVDGVDRVSASVTAHRVHLDISTSSEQATEIRDRVVRGVTELLAAARLAALPRVTATVRTRKL